MESNIRVGKEARRAVNRVGERDSNNVDEDGDRQLRYLFDQLVRARANSCGSIGLESGPTRHRQPFNEHLRLAHKKAKNEEK